MTRGRRLSRTAVAASILAGTVLVACHSSRNAPAPSAPTPAPVAAPAPYTAPISAPAAMDPVAAQAARGQALFEAHCAACHGVSGEGSTSAPALVGPGSLPLDPPAGRMLRRTRFATARDLGMFVKDQMPPRGAHLPPNDVAAVLAWLLERHGVTPPRPIDPTVAASIPLPH